MSSFSLQTNSPAFQKANKAKLAAFLERAKYELDRLNRFFIAKIQREQMNFRKDSPVNTMGTRVQTGLLKRNWFDRVITATGSIQTRVWSTTPYAPVHEYGGLFRRSSAFGRPTQPFWVQYHKRLRIGQAWEKDYGPAMRVSINKAFADTMGATA